MPRPVLRSEKPGARAFRCSAVERGFPGGHEAVEEAEEGEELVPPFAVGGSFPREEEFSGQPVVQVGDEPLGADDLACDFGLEDDPERAEEGVVRRLERVPVGEPAWPLPRQRSAASSL